jgi:hypothetical protein
MSELDDVKAKRAARAAATLDTARTIYLDRVVDIVGSPIGTDPAPSAAGVVEGKTHPRLTAEDLNALAAIAQDKPEGAGAWKYPVALAIVFITVAILVLGSRTAPLTALTIVAETDYVAVNTAPDADAASLRFDNAARIDALHLRLNGNAQAQLLSPDGSVGQSCPTIPIDRSLTLRGPEGLELTFASGAELRLSVFKTPGVASVDQMRIAGDGAWMLKAILPRARNVTGDCSHFGGNEWRLPAMLAIQAHGVSEMLIQVPRGDRDLPATALLPRIDLVASRVSFEVLASNALLSVGPPSRCAVIEGSLDFEQHIPLIGVRNTGREELGKRQCPTLVADANRRWRVVVDPAADGHFEVTQRASDDGGIGQLFLNGTAGGRQIGASYLAILKSDPGLALLFGVATAVITNLWSFAQLLRRWVS